MPNDYSLFERGHFMSTLLILYGEKQTHLSSFPAKPTPRHLTNLLDRLIACEKRRPGQYSLVMEKLLGISSSKLG